MWKSIGSIKNGDDVSVRSNRSRYDINEGPFHGGLKKKSNVSPDINRSFCYEYFQKRRNKTLNESAIASNNSLKRFVSGGSNQDIFTEMRNKVSKEEQGSRITDRVIENPECSKKNKKNYDQLKKASNRLQILKKQQTKLKNTMQSQFNTFKNMFYQLQEHIHPHQNDFAVKETATMAIDQIFFRDLLGQAMSVQRYFQQMDRKKSAIMQRLAE